jgi:hypothetical protein
MGYAMLGGELVAIRGHCVCGALGVETARRCVFWKGDRGVLKFDLTRGDLEFEGRGGEEAGETPA